MKIVNKRATFDFEIENKFEAGIKLTGAEAKAVREGHADLTGSFMRIIGNEAYLVNSKIYPYKFARPEGYLETRTRKLLLHRKEIQALKSKMEGAGLSCVPLSLHTTGDFIKVELALGRGKKKYQKKEAIKKRDIQRDIDREISS